VGVSREENNLIRMKEEGREMKYMQTIFIILLARVCISAELNYGEGYISIAFYVSTMKGTSVRQ
jgi:hypothetical protein